MSHQIESVHSATDGDEVGLFVRGNISDEEFIKMVRAECERFDVDVPTGPVLHERWRTIPDPKGNCASLYRRGQGRGSFEVTTIEIEEWTR